MPSADSYERAAKAKKSATSPDAVERRAAALEQQRLDAIAAQKAQDKKDKAAEKAAAAAKAAKAKADAEAARQRAAALAAQRAEDAKAAQAAAEAAAAATAAKPEESLYESGSTSSTTASTPTLVGPSTDVKIATSNLFIFEEVGLTAETMTDLVFEDIGGRELIDIVSGDMVYDLATQAAPNQPIKNLSSIVERYSPKNLINMQGTSDKFFQSNFQIDINSYIPLGSDVMDNPHVYIVTPQTSSDAVNEQLLDHLVIEVVNINVANNERVEVQILSYDELYDDTIY